MHVHEIIATHPDVHGSVNHALLDCIEHCFDCEQACIVCADACLAEEEVDALKQCIRLNLDCADVCRATGSMASRRTGSNELLLREMLEVCRAACEICGQECRRHAAEHAHCRVCAEACAECRDSCEQAALSVRPS
ncbi:MAG: four-helix bundle copper-binding protein [Gammaproteobacteria bacterium]|jgi:hypothetical protein|nr:four-helix bundle copper-binding protein [Gammaproteobacteria bacterium]